VIISRRIRWLGHVLGMVERRGAYYSGLVGKPGVKRPLAKRKYRWDDSIQMDTA
jgi:hypothetical protein